MDSIQNRMDLFKNTLFINLEHRNDRLEHATEEFKKMDIKAERVDAIKKDVGAVGCTMSHIKCLEIAKKRNYDYVFICEDDIHFKNPELLKQNLEKFNQNTKINWDVLIIGGNNARPYQIVEEYCSRVFYCRTTTGYIVKKHMYDILLDNFNESVSKLTQDSSKESIKKNAIDMYWQRLQYQYFWYMITPPTVTQYTSYSDIENTTCNTENLLLDMKKEWCMPQHLIPTNK
jgi:glycosyl transferase, family 25